MVDGCKVKNHIYSIEVVQKIKT